MEESDGATADSVWFGYECKSGEILFYYNQKTGEHRWAKDLCSSVSNVIKVSISDLSVKHPSDVHSVGTQTEDYGCTNGCSSMYIHNEDHTVTSNRDESMCIVDLPSNICEVSLEQSETMIPNTKENNVIDEEFNGGSVKLENDEDCILTDNCQLSIKMKSRNDSPLCERKKSIEKTEAKDQQTETKMILYQNVDQSLYVDRETHTEKFFGSLHCDEQSGWKEGLNQHLQIFHTVVKPFECSFCGKGFLRKCDLNCHMARHTNERPFKCSQCDKAFRYRSNLSDHTQTHTGEKPFKCSHCGKAFSRKPGLNRHIRIHTGEKPFKCSHCGKAFGCKSNLNGHIKTHTGEMPFKCSQCYKAFLRKSGLNRHIRTHTGEN